MANAATGGRADMRRKLQRWFPDPDSIREKKWLRWCAPVLGHPRLWHLHRRSVALGVAVGLVTGMIPGPVQMLLAALIAIPLRANIPAAVFTTLYTNPFTFVPLYILAYNVGRLVTGDAAPLALPHDVHWTFSGMSDYLGELMRWMASLGDTLLIGLAIQLAAFAVIGYVATLVIWRCAVSAAWRRRSRLRAARAHP
jgi:uncharacterized protein (DUF2062 family)